MSFKAVYPISIISKRERANKEKLSLLYNDTTKAINKQTIGDMQNDEVKKALKSFSLIKGHINDYMVRESIKNR